MRIYLLRHGATEWNAQHRYQGRQTDAPLSPEGLASLRPAGFSVDAVYVSPMRRARQTAERLFPGAVPVAVPGLEEMDFGAFEGRTAAEMENDAAYRAWVDGWCLGSTPGGEDRAAFSRRVCGAFAALVDEALDAGRETLAIVAHGGVQMVVMERYALPQRDYWQWQTPLAGGWVLETDRESWLAGQVRLAGSVTCAVDAGNCGHPFS